MDSGKLKKLQDYSIVLKSQAESKEAQGNRAEAVKDYVKLVDILLLLANETSDHQVWQRLISQAEEYQRKVRVIADPNFKQERTKSPAYEIKTSDKEPGQTSILNPFRSLIGKSQDAKTEASQAVAAPGIISSWAKDLNTKPTPPPQNMPVQIEKEDSVSFSLYSQLLHEKTVLSEELESIRTKEKEYIATIESKNREISVIKSELSSRIPRSEYDSLKESLSKDVVPIEKYIELQKELERRIQNSVPSMILDEMKEYISFLVSTLPRLEEQADT